MTIPYLVLYQHSPGCWERLYYAEGDVTSGKGGIYEDPSLNITGIAKKAANSQHKDPFGAKIEHGTRILVVPMEEGFLAREYEVQDGDDGFTVVEV